MEMKVEMNVVVITGKIVSDVDFKFIYNKEKKEKHTSIAMCKLVLDNGSIVDIYGYDEVADYLYMNNNKYIFVEGIIDSNMMIEIKYIII